MKKKVLISSILTIALCLCLIAGSTWALFTDNATAGVAVTAGNLDVIATVDDAIVTRSLGDAADRNREGAFANGGSADLGEDGKLVITAMTPGDVVSFTIAVANGSNIALRYKVTATSTIGEDATVDLSDALTVTALVNGQSYVMSGTNKSFETDWIPVGVEDGAGVDITDITVTVEFPNGTPEHDNAFRGAGASIVFAVEAVQDNGVDGNGDLILPSDD